MTWTIPILVDNLRSGPFGLLALFAILWAFLLPFTLYRKAYAFSLGYAFSVFAASVTMLTVIQNAAGVDNGRVPAGGDPLKASAVVVGTARRLLQVCTVWGLRLGIYLLVRDVTRNRKAGTTNKPLINDGSVGSRVVLSFGLALFYATMLTPALYAMRGAAAAASSVDEGGKSLVPSSSSFGIALSQTGVLLSTVGVILESVADLQKFVTKQGRRPSSPSKGGAGGPKPVFVGPTGLTYQISRHPNYLGEVLVWTGQFLGGVPFYGNSIQAWVWSTLGWVGIVSVMRMATKRLESRQWGDYGGQREYDEWTQSVRGSLFPYVP
jgi:steroid 5-alpha reductase family enzyme